MGRRSLMSGLAAAAISIAISLPPDPYRFGAGDLVLFKGNSKRRRKAKQQKKAKKG